MALPRSMSSLPPTIDLHESNKSKSAPVIAGLVTGGVAALILASLLFWLYQRRKASKVELDPLAGSGAWPEPLILHTAVSPSSGSGGLQKDQEETVTGEPSRIKASGESSPTVTPMVSLGSLPSTGLSRSHDLGNSFGSTLNASPCLTHANAERSRQSPQEVIVRHRDGCCVLVELPPLYEEGQRLGRVDNSAPLPISARANGAEYAEKKTNKYFHSTTQKYKPCYSIEENLFLLAFQYQALEG